MMLKSKTIYMRLANEDDAKFILSLRSDNKFSQFISKTESSLAKQINWMRDYKERERSGKEYYFIIVRRDNDKEIGTVRVYDLRELPKSFCWGSWILNEDKTASSAIESALLVYDLAFNKLNFEQSHFDVRNDNQKVLNFHKKLGAKEVSNDENDTFFIYQKTTFVEASAKFKRFMEQK